MEVVAHDPDYRSYFVDQIRLIIHDPGKPLPKTFDANYATSIDFAPTVAHLMGFDSNNSFLGNSLFDESIEPAKAGIAAAGDEYFLIVSGGVRRDDDPGGDPDEIQYIRRLVHTIHQLELHDRIRPPDVSKTSPVVEPGDGSPEGDSSENR